MALPDSATIERLLLQADDFFLKTHHVKVDLGLEPKKDHIITCINYADMVEMRAEFVEELIHLVVDFVYSAVKQERFIRGQSSSTSAAWSRLRTRALKKFRRDAIQGQFAEMLLFVLLQRYFRAAPLVRKMPITTNPQVERHGADAIHVSIGPQGRVKLFIGEAKTFDRGTYSGSAAVSDAIKDVLLHYKEHRSELHLYAYEDFLPDELEDLARAYLKGENVANVEVHLVAIATFDSEWPMGTCRTTTLESVIDTVKAQLKRLPGSKAIRNFPENLRPRLNLIIFPVRELNLLLDEFTKSLV